MAPRSSKIFKNIITSKGKIQVCLYDFINELKIRPVLWNTMHIDFKNTAIVEQNWNGIGGKCIPYFAELDVDEKKQILKKLKHYWTTLKTGLTNSLQKTKNGIGSHIHYLIHMEFFLNSKYVYLKDIATEEELKILIENEIKLRDQAGLQPPEIVRGKKYHQNGDVLKVATPSEKNVKVNITPINNANNTSFDPMSLCQVINELSIHDIKQEVVDDNQQFDYHQQQEITHIRIQKTFGFPVEPPYDDDQAFFDTIKPILCKLNDLEKLNLKTEVLDILKKYT